MLGFNKLGKVEDLIRCANILAGGGIYESN
jgi:hypothetical protein